MLTQATLQAALGALANLLAVLVLAPLAEGLVRKVTARLQSRQGPPLLQPYFDLLKLLGKEDLECGVVPGLQRFASRLAFASTLALAAFLPMGFAAPLHAAGDVLVLAYLLTLPAVAILLAGLAAGSTFSLLGVSREMMTVITLEPLLVIALLVGALHADSLHLDAVLGPGLYASSRVPLSGLLLLGITLYGLQGFLKRVPFDVAEAETEIMEGALVEYSGPKLALFKHAQMSRLIVYGGLLANLFVPWGSQLAWPLAVLLFWLKVLAVVLLATVVAATHARYRVDQTLQRFAWLLGLGFAALALASYGY